jgi:hypothetical protein
MQKEENPMGTEFHKPPRISSSTAVLPHIKPVGHEGGSKTMVTIAVFSVRE